MQVHVDDIETHVARPYFAQNRVQVRAVVVQQAAGIVDDFRHLHYAPFKHAHGRWVGQHDARGFRANGCLQRGEINITVCIRWQFAHRATAHRRCRRIGAVCGVRHDNFGTLGIAASHVIGTNHGDSRQFALRPGHGCQ